MTWDSLFCGGFDSLFLSVPTRGPWASVSLSRKKGNETASLPHSVESNESKPFWFLLTRDERYRRRPSHGILNFIFCLNPDSEGLYFLVTFLAPLRSCPHILANRMLQHLIQCFLIE